MVRDSEVERITEEYDSEEDIMNCGGARGGYLAQRILDLKRGEYISRSNLPPACGLRYDPQKNSLN